MNHLYAGGAENRQHGLEILRSWRDARVVIHFLPLREAKGYGELLTHGLAYRLHDLGRKPYPGPDIVAAIAICAAVRLRPKELVQKIAVTGMHFDTSRANLSCGECSADEGIADCIQILRGGGASVGLSCMDQP